MKRNFKYYAVIWLVLIALFNVFCFVTPSELGNYYKFDATFWAAYIFITIALLVNLVCAFFAFRAENLTKMFYNLPLITISYTGLILMIIFGTVCMAIPNLPTWIAIIVCALILGFNVMAVVKALWAADAVSDIDAKVKDKTAFIKMLTVEAESLMSGAKSDAVKAECKKVYEAIRYSDPCSDPRLDDIEVLITKKLHEMEDELSSEEENLRPELVEELISLIRSRNEKCKLYK